MKRITGYLLVALMTLVALPRPTAAQGTPMPDVRIQFLDNNGLPCNGCLLNAYAAGTSTRQATYTNIGLTVANANPVVLDSAGRPTTGYIYLSATTYRFVLTDSTGATQYWEADNTPAIPNTSAGVDISNQTAGEALSAGDVAYLSDGSGAKVAGRWYKADSANTYSSSYAGMVGIATTAIASTASGTIRIAGRATGLSGLTTGTTYYVGTAGALTATAPTNARKVGAADSTSTLDFSNQDYASVLTRTFRVNAATPYTWTLPSADAYGPLQSDGAGVVSFAGWPNHTAEGRLTATTGNPTPTGDVSAAASIFYTPYNGNHIALYDGSAAWKMRTFTEITISVAACTASKPYDVFLFDNSGTVTSEILVWTSATARATALVRQDGVLVKTGATTRRYVGSFYCNSSGGQTDDTVLKRNVYNEYNRIRRELRVTDATDSWAYVTAAWRQANASAANQVEVMVGTTEVVVHLQVGAGVASTSVGVQPSVGIGEDSTTTILADLLIPVSTTLASTGPIQYVMALADKQPAEGRHVYSWNEWGAANSTFYGDNGSTNVRSGMIGWTEN